MNNLKHFWNVLFNPLVTRFLFYFTGESMSVSNITENQINGFSLNFQDR